MCGDYAVFAGGDEELGGGEDASGYLAYMKVLEEASGFAAIVVKLEANAVVCKAPF